MAPVTISRLSIRPYFEAHDDKLLVRTFNVKTKEAREPRSSRPGPWKFTLWIPIRSARIGNILGSRGFHKWSRTRESEKADLISLILHEAIVWLATAMQ